MTLTLSTDSQQAANDAIVDRYDLGSGPGKIIGYSGTPPANAKAGLSGNTPLFELPLSDPAFGATNASGVATANSIASANALASGTATFWRGLDSDNNVIEQGSVSATGGGGDMQLASVEITAPNPVDITSFTHTQPDGS